MPITVDTAFLDTMPANVAVQFFDRVAASPDSEAFRFPRGEAWESVTWKQAGDKVEALAAGLIALGVEPEQRVGIASGTRYEWILADLAIMCAAGATTTVYPSTNAEDTTYILGDSESRVVFVEDAEQLTKLTAHRAELPHVSKVVIFDGKADGDWVITLEDLAAMGAKLLAEQPDVVRTTSQAIKPDQLATLIYTSGTTGRPKGAPAPRITLEQAAEAVREQLPDLEPSFVQLPSSAYRHISVGGRGNYPLIFETVDVNPYNGKVERTRRVSDRSALELVTGSMRPLHTGDFAGVWLKLVYFVFGLLLTTLVFSGMMVWTKRTALETVKLVRERKLARFELEAAE
jgi:acyl-CoA synthetase (AMP-forming)/AMP-acid ligase II